MSSLDVRAIDETDLRKANRPKTKHELTVFLSEEAFDRAVERGDGDTTREIGGVLVGELLRDDAGPYLKIDTTIDALHAEEKGAELTFTHATWEHINKEMDTTHKGKKVVGWYHTHPGFGVFLSDRDQFIHKSFFNLPFQVAFVYDPKSKEHGLYTWRDNEVWRQRRYTIGARDHVWDGNRTTARPTDAADKKDPDQPRRDDDRAAKDSGDESLLGGSLAPLVMIGVVVVLVAGFVGHWLGASSGNAAIVSAQLEIAKARGDGAKLAIASLEHDLVGLLRETLGDQAIQRPARQAVGELDAAVASLQALVPAGPAVVPGGPAVAPPPPVDPKLATAIARLTLARDGFVRLSQDRSSAEATFAAMEQATRRGADQRTDLAREVSEQRAGVAGLYAELAIDVAKTDRDRARRLLATAALLDPGNRLRYEKQLQSFDQGGTLPRPSGAAASTPRMVPKLEGGKP